MNDYENEPAWIPFGDVPGQVLHPGTAETMLRMLAERQPAQFGALLAEAMTGQAPKARRSS